MADFAGFSLQPLSAVQVPWFSDINPGDAMFVYNISPTAVTIPWQ